MLITQLKPKETIEPLVTDKTFIITCQGCKEVFFPESDANQLQKELVDGKGNAGALTADYICSPENLDVRLRKHADKIQAADTVLVFSCGVGVQTVAKKYADKRVFSGCDSFRLPGFQGVTPLEHDCGQCGECYLNYTGGICPITACSKSLINGQCGGAKQGKCEVNKEMDCGWERIYRKLESIDRLSILDSPTRVRNFAPVEGLPESDAN